LKRTKKRPQYFRRGATREAEKKKKSDPKNDELKLERKRKSGFRGQKKGRPYPKKRYNRGRRRGKKNVAP